MLLGRVQMPVGASLAPASARAGESGAGFAFAPTGAGDAEDGRIWSLVEADGAVSPPSLQIVMTRLYLDALAAANYMPPPEKPDPAHPWTPPPLQLTLAGYRVSGGARVILAGYIEKALAKLGTEEKYPGDRRLAEAMLKALVTTKETKPTLGEAELLDELVQAQADFDPVAELAALRITRASLVNLCLLRSLKVGERSLVELAHDHMAVEIATWIDETAMQAKLTRELLRQQVESWQRHKLLIALDALRLIHAQREQLRRLSGLEAELLLRSTLATGEDVPTWFERACRAGVVADKIVLEGLKSDNFRTRAAAVTALAQLGERFADALIPMLADAYPQVRVATIVSLERLQPDGVWRAHLKYECYVPAGEFIMGDDRSAQKAEKPAHRVYLDAFYIGKYPVTNAEYACYRKDNGQPFEMPFGKESHPVVEVSWYDAARLRGLGRYAAVDRGGMGKGGIVGHGDGGTRGHGEGAEVGVSVG